MEKYDNLDTLETALNKALQNQLPRHLNTSSLVLMSGWFVNPKKVNDDKRGLIFLVMWFICLIYLYLLSMMITACVLVEKVAIEWKIFAELKLLLKIRLFVLFVFCSLLWLFWSWILGFIYYGSILAKKEEETEKFYPTYSLLNKCWNFYVTPSIAVMK